MVYFGGNIGCVNVGREIITRNQMRKNSQTKNRGGKDITCFAVIVVAKIYTICHL